MTTQQKSPHPGASEVLHSGDKSGNLGRASTARQQADHIRDKASLDKGVCHWLDIVAIACPVFKRTVLVIIVGSNFAQELILTKVSKSMATTGYDDLMLAIKVKGLPQSMGAQSGIYTCKVPYRSLS